MAFILRFNNPLDGQGDQADFGSPIAMGVGDYFELDAIIPSSNPSSAIVLIQNSSNWLGFNGTQAARANIGGSITTGTAGSLTPYLDVLTTYRFTRTATAYEVRANGNLILTAPSTAQLTVSRWGQGGTSSYVNMDFYEGRYYDASGTLVHEWIPNNVSGSVADSVGDPANNLTLTNFAADPYISIDGITSIAGSASGVTLRTGETAVPFTTSNFDPISAVFTDDNNTLPLSGFTYSSNSGTFNTPVLGDVPNHVKFGPCFIDMTDGTNTYRFPFTYAIEAPYQVVTIADKISNEKSIDRLWVSPLVNTDQFALDTTYATPSADSTFDVTTALADFTSRAFAIDSAGMEEFVFQSAALNADVTLSPNGTQTIVDFSGVALSAPGNVGLAVDGTQTVIAFQNVQLSLQSNISLTPDATETLIDFDDVGISITDTAPIRKQLSELTFTLE